MKGTTTNSPSPIVYLVGDPSVSKEDLLKVLYYPTPYRLSMPRGSHRITLYNDGNEEVATIKLKLPRRRERSRNMQRKATAMYIVKACNHYPEFLKALRQAKNDLEIIGDSPEAAISAIDAVLKAAGE